MNTSQIIAIAVIAVMAIIYIVWLIKKNGLKGAAVRLIVEAEKNIEGNEEKMAYCIEKLIALIPMPFSLFITTDIVQDLIQKVFDQVKIALDYQPKK